MTNHDKLDPKRFFDRTELRVIVDLTVLESDQLERVLRDLKQTLARFSTEQGLLALEVDIVDTPMHRARQIVAGGWTGVEVDALIRARGMDVHGFAEHLGVHERVVGRWKAGGAAVRPRTAGQEYLNTSLGMADNDQLQRFIDILSPTEANDTQALASDSEPEDRTQ